MTDFNFQICGDVAMEQQQCACLVDEGKWGVQRSTAAQRTAEFVALGRTWDM
jgi:hypothetical protein